MDPVTPPLPFQRSLSDLRAEDTRNEYLKHEASVRSVGTLYLFKVGLFTLGFFGSFFGERGLKEKLPAIFGFLALGVLCLWIGIGLRKLNPKAQIPATIISALGLLGFPLGTIISAYILYLLQSKKGKYVFSEEYAGIVAATPHIKYRTSIIVWIALIALFLVLGLGLFAVVVSKFKASP